MDSLAWLYQARPGLTPSGLIFHWSRCGSTLISQMLAALPDTVVLSEVPPLDTILRAGLHDPLLDFEDNARWVKWMMSALGQPRSGEEKHLLIKFDAWSMLSYPLVRHAFPDVPWTFVYREPLEIMVSQLRRRGAHLVPNALHPALFEMDSASVLHMPAEDFCACVLAKVAEAALEHAERDGGLLVNYKELPQVVWTDLLDLFGMQPGREALQGLRRTARLDAKNPVLDFAPDVAEKQRDATAQLRAATDRWLRPVYERLEALRLARRTETTSPR